MNIEHLVVRAYKTMFKSKGLSTYSIL